MQIQVSKKSQLKRLHILKTGADLVLHKGLVPLDYKKF